MPKWPSRWGWSGWNRNKLGRRRGSIWETKADKQLREERERFEQTYMPGKPVEVDAWDIIKGKKPPHG